MQPKMRLSPNDSLPGGPHPIRLARFTAGLSQQAFASSVGLKPLELSNLEAGRTPELRESWRDGFVAAGYDFDDLRARCASWWDLRHANPAVTLEAAREPANEVEKAILDAIKAGARGVRNIASRSGVPFGVVQQYLRQGQTQAQA